MAATLFTDADRRRISRAITAAEKECSGEIVAVVAGRSDDYYFIPFLWAALAALAAPLVLLPFLPWSSWQVYALQLVVFAAAGALALWPTSRLMMVPRAIKRARAHRHGLEQFLAQNLHTTRGRTGVLIFVSVAERYAEVIADEGIYQKVPPETWVDIVNSLTERIREGRAADGFVEAIRACGAILAEHFPPGAADRDELPNHLIELPR